MLSKNTQLGPRYRGVGPTTSAQATAEAERLQARATLPKTTIESVDFALLTKKQMQELSVVNVTETAPSAETFPRHSPHDESLGALKGTCHHCGSLNTTCRGHYGFIDLQCTIAPAEKPLRQYIRLLVRSICTGCGKLILDDFRLRGLYEQFQKILEQDPITQRLDLYIRHLETVAKNSANIVCCHANEPDHPADLQYSMRFPPKTDPYSKAGLINGVIGRDKVVWKPLDFYVQALDKLTLEQLKYLGYTNAQGEVRVYPSAYFISGILVRPLTTRQPTLTENQRKLHPLTEFYNHVLRAARTVRGAKWELEMARKTLTKSEQSSATDTYNTAVGTLQKVLYDFNVKWKDEITNKKTGALKNITGKSTENIVRAVIVPGPHLRANEVGIPIDIAEKLTVRVLVTEENLSEINELIKNGHVKTIFPRSNILECASIRITLNNRHQQRAHVGDYVERRLQDGDVVLISRPPVLTGLSLLSAVVRIFGREVVDYASGAIRLPLTATSILAADYDGDCLMVSIPQTEAAVQELLSVMAANQVMISPKDGSLVYTGIHDMIAGCYYASLNPLKPGDEVTKDKGWVTMDVFEQLIQTVSFQCNGEISQEGKDLGIMNKMDDFKRRLQKHGKVFSILDEEGIECIPTDVMLSWVLPPDLPVYKTPTCTIHDGILVKGSLNKSVIGSGNETLMHAVALTGHRERAMTLLSDIEKIATAYLSRIGPSVGWKDCHSVMAEVQSEVVDIANTMSTKIASLQNSTMESREYLSRYELVIAEANAKMTSVVEKAMMGKENTMMDIVNAGAKGSTAHVMSIVASQMQQWPGGHAPVPTLAGGRRYSFYGEEGDLDVSFTGMCLSSLAEGVTPQEAVNTAMVARQNFISLGTGTPECGSTQLMLLRLLSGEILNKAGGVIDESSKGRLVQCLYGGDGLDPTRVERIRRVYTAPEQGYSVGGTYTTFANLQRFTDELNAKVGWYRI